MCKGNNSHFTLKSFKVNSSGFGVNMAEKAVENPPASQVEKPWEKRKRMFELATNRKSRFPPFSIEPLPYERQRLDGQGMTPEERALRRQWVMDQTLSPNEPRTVPELHPRNAFKRVAAAPFETLYKVLRPVIGETPAKFARHLTPVILGMYGSALFIYYHMKYHSNDWTKSSGFYVSTIQPQFSAGMSRPFPEQEDSDYYSRGFKSRKTLLNVKTSSQE